MSDSVMFDYAKFSRKLGATKVADTLTALEHDTELKKTLEKMFMRARRLQFWMEEPITMSEPFLRKVVAKLEEEVGSYPALARVVIDDFDHLVERGTHNGETFSQPYVAMAKMMSTMLSRNAARAALDEIQKGE